MCFRSMLLTDGLDLQVKDTMVACMGSAADGAARQTCKDTVAKAALATALGKQASDVSATDVYVSAS